VAKRKYKAEETVAVLRRVELSMANLPRKRVGRTALPSRPLIGGARSTRAQARAGQTAQGAGEGELVALAAADGAVIGEADLAGGRPGTLVSPQRRRCAAWNVRCESSRLQMQPGLTYRPVQKIGQATSKIRSCR
jgi:hypothetical protein